MASWSNSIKGWGIAVLVTVLLITGCSANPGAQEEQAQTLVTENAASGDIASETNQETETRVVQDEFGDVTIPVHPQRIAGIYVEDYLKALDITPVVQWYNPMWGVQEYLDLDVPQFDTTGSIEALLQYDLDLIIVDGGVDMEKYEMYSKVAPTYRLPEDILQDSNQILTTIADVVGKPDKGKEVVAAYEAKIADAKAKLKEAVGGETVAVVRLNISDNTLALFGIKNRFTGFIYSELGLTPHPLVSKMEEYQEILSEEGIPELDADHIILFPSNGDWSSPENKEALKVLDSKLWKSLPAVKNNQVYMMERSYWQSGAITANSMKIDDLLQKMTP
ncbi:ABC transporter substrate-binding protein [Paenibacillus xylanilyticus]|uniref:ABC transporter substrate-binding protein n=1 Tax=Paenibacillus xylanilyticus TaxID=248903 RepID=A0A7Y6EWK3_9BACL|nr:ABC transporter substrate-binding protein [Paenibacillus xylanilyticus]NUU76540.1 ABC transporter substrate-binding protein [Paenibacillus xylanilyticus]